MATGKSFVVGAADAGAKAEWLAAFDTVLVDIRKQTKETSAAAPSAGGGSVAGTLDQRRIDNCRHIMVESLWRI